MDRRNVLVGRRIGCSVGWGRLVLDWIGKGDGIGGDGAMLSLGLGLSCDWAIVCGVCYYRNLLQMQQFRPKPRPRLVMANSADNTRERRNIALYHIENNVK